MNGNNMLKLSFEFFPPRSQAMQRRLWRAMGQLERLDPLFYSMTYGALGSAQQVSVDTVLAMHHESPVPVAAHLTAADATRETVEAAATRFYDAGIRAIVTLRGDETQTESRYAFPSAAELVAALHDRWLDVDLNVAAYPEVHPDATSADSCLSHLQRKLDAGATRAITQYFFDADTFLRFRDRAAAKGINKPLVPGILPVHDPDKVKAFSARCGATFPDWLAERFERAGTDASTRYKLAVETALALCEQLRAEGVEHFHFYTLNQTDLCLDISLALGASLRRAA